MQVVVTVRRDGPVVQAGARRDRLAVQHVREGRAVPGGTVFAVEREVGDAEIRRGRLRQGPEMFDFSRNLSEASLPSGPPRAL
ncbi:MAG: hypothetical protein Tsb0032_03920 [Kiloniellaceae bacterium]